MASLAQGVAWAVMVMRADPAAEEEAERAEGAKVVEPVVAAAAMEEVTTLHLQSMRMET